MSKIFFRALLLLLALAPFAPAEAQWVFVARKAAQRIHHMAIESEQAGGPRREFVVVILEAPADRVYATALDTVPKSAPATLAVSVICRRIL